MTQLTSANLEWLWDFDKHQPHVRHWPAVARGRVHIHDNSDLSTLRKLAPEARDVDHWTDLYLEHMTAEHFTVSVDTLADMIDHNRDNCLGEAANLKGYSESVFALVRGEILTSLPFPARLALLSDGLATIDTHDHGKDVREALEELTVSDLQTLAQQSGRIPKKQRKADLIEALAAAEESGEVALPLGDISPAPPIHGWIENLIQQYVSTLRQALADPVYPDAFREAVWHKAIEQATINPLRRALELEYWQVLETGIEETEPLPDDTAEDETLRAEPRFNMSSGDWSPAIAQHNRDAPVAWLAIGLLFVGWLFF